MLQYEKLPQREARPQRIGRSDWVSFSLHLVSLLQGQASFPARLDDLHPLRPLGPFKLHKTVGNNKKRTINPLVRPHAKLRGSSVHDCSELQCFHYSHEHDL